MRTFTEGGAMKWVTRPGPKADRIACRWLIRRFIDDFAKIDGNWTSTRRRFQALYRMPGAFPGEVAAERSELT
jgi:hypothetical protein